MHNKNTKHTPPPPIASKMRTRKVVTGEPIEYWQDYAPTLKLCKDFAPIKLCQDHNVYKFNWKSVILSIGFITFTSLIVNSRFNKKEEIPQSNDINSTNHSVLSDYSLKTSLISYSAISYIFTLGSSIGSHFIGYGAELVVKVLFSYKGYGARHPKLKIIMALLVHELVESSFTSNFYMHFKDIESYEELFSKTVIAVGWHNFFEFVTTGFMSFIAEKEYQELTGQRCCGAIDKDGTWNKILVNIKLGIASCIGSAIGSQDYEAFSLFISYLNKVVAQKDVKTITQNYAVNQSNKHEPIIEEVQALGNGAEVEVAKVAIDSNNYDVKFKLDSSGDSENISGATITITRTAAPSDQAGLATIINDLYIKQDGSGGFTIETDTTDAVQLSCADTIFSQKAVGNCDSITLPSGDNTQKEEMDKVLKELKDSETVNTKGSNKLKDVSTETIDTFTKTVAQNPVDITAANLDKVQESYIKIETATELSSDDVWSLIDCIMQNECN